ncbi:MAG: hypothetical protein IPI69_05510 [Bacteroidales bacterium]|nr:hypothetical protein [Bacteroidales bacterium]
MTSSRKPPEVKPNKNYLYHLLLFIASIIIVVAISPREGKFRYEFQKGKPWLSSSLIAPWDFAVEKPDEVIIAERDSILQNFAPYFKLDPEVGKNKIADFDNYLNEVRENVEKESRAIDPKEFQAVKRSLIPFCQGYIIKEFLKAMS